MKKNRLIYGNVFSPGHHAPEACVVCGKRFVSKKALGAPKHPKRSRRGLLPPTGEPAATRNGNTTAPLQIDLNQPAPEEQMLAMITMGYVFYSTTAFFGYFMVQFSLLLMRRLYE